MSFAHPALLLLLALPAALLVGVWRADRGARLALPFDHGAQGSGWGWRLLLDAARSLPAFVLAVAVVLLAGPQRWSEPRTRRALTNIQFCLDVSGSMTAEFGTGSRYDAAMAAINQFLEHREGDAFGLTVFGNQVLHWVPLTTDPSAFRCATPFLRPELLPWWFGGTEIGKALLACRDVLVSREEGDRMIILVSDGYSADLGGGNDAKVAAALAEAGIVVYAVHAADGEPPLELSTITSVTGGEVFAAGDPAALSAVFQRIDAMQETKLERVAGEAVDAFAPWCAAGLGLLGAALLAGLGLRATPW